MNGETKQWPASPDKAWKVRIELDVPSLCAPVLQYAVFSEEPVAQFKSDLMRVHDAYQARLNEIRDLSQRLATRAIQLSVVWDHLFRIIPGDEVYLLTPGSSENVLMSNEPVGKRWIVTKATRISDRAVCWAVPCEAVVGEEVQVKLTESNALNLAALDNGGRE